VSGPCIIHGPSTAHGLHFVDRKQLTDYQDVLYEDKPQLNFMGIEYRKPKRVIRIHTAGDQPKTQLSASTIEEALAAWFDANPGKKPKQVTYPGIGAREFRGFTLEPYGYVGIMLVAGGEACEEVAVG
jgi:hypothetical protein